MPRRATSFDSYVMVDWSAAARPRRGRDSIWIGALDRDAQGRCTRVDLCNPPTRADAESRLAAALLARAGRRVLVGIDVALGYSRGFAAAIADLSPTDPAARDWSLVWSVITARLTDAPDNANNRFAVAAEINRTVTGRVDGGPFWGAPRGTDPAPSRRKGDFPAATRPTSAGPSSTLEEFRHAERLLRASGARPLSAWQLLGAGSVGSQTLTAIPMLQRLRTDERFAHRMRIWPFETGLVDITHSPAARAAAGPAPFGPADDHPADGEAIVVAEVWPGIPAAATDLGAVSHPVRDAAQMAALAAWAARADDDRTLGALFAPSLDDSDAASAVDAEGWILGVLPDADRRPRTL